MTDTVAAGPGLDQLCKELLEHRRLILVSNRGPVQFSQSGDGKLTAQRGSGGVVTALTALGQFADLTWIAAAMGDGDRQALRDAGEERVRSPISDQELNLRFVDIPRSNYHKYYNVFCNPLLWFVQHYMWNTPRTPNISDVTYDAWGDGYVKVNQTFADAVVKEVEDDAADDAPIILFQDYHLYLAPGEVRKRLPNAILQHFIHIPWPGPTYWKLLPRFMRVAICENLCANDVVGLQTTADVQNFLLTIQSVLPEAEVDSTNYFIWHQGRLTRVNAYPISIDVARIERLAGSDRVRRYQDAIEPLMVEKTIVRVDRLEPSKNIIRGFRAYEQLLDRHPDLCGKVSFLAFLVPSRTSVRQYQRYADEVNQLIESINQRLGTDEWTPIRLFLENNYAQAIAGMKLYDVLLVNAVVDGMNLVAKEGPLVNQRDGALILSDSVGAFEQLGDHALEVTASDIEGTSRALYGALHMPARERARRAKAMRDLISKEDIAVWLYRQFLDIRALV